jgi:hypothetical protein
MAFSKAGDRVRMRWDYTQKAIALAQESRWQETVETNQRILQLFPEDVEAWNRLGKAWMELGEYGEARAAFQQVLELAPSNAIARRNLAKVSSDAGSPPVAFGAPSPQLFIEEAGKTGVTTLIHLGSNAVLERLSGGEPVSIRVEGASLVIRDRREDRVGEVEPRLALRLTNLINGGNQYVAAVVSVIGGEVRIIIKEAYRSPHQQGKNSFPSHRTEGFRSYVKATMIRDDVEEASASGEEDEEEDEELTMVAEEEAATADVEDAEEEDEEPL